MRRWLLLSVALLACLAAVAAADDPDYYDTLELTEREDATERQIKANWRKLSRENHPDLKGEETRDKYKAIQRAYEVLSDRKKRKVFDMKGEEGLKQLEKADAAGGRGNMHMDPIARMFGMGGGNNDGAAKGHDVQMVLLVTLEDIYNRAAHHVKFNKQRLCKKCKGTGADSKEDFSICSKCKGRGTVTQRIQLMPGFVQQMEQPCPKCNGKGKQIKKKCTLCKGKKVSRVDAQLDIDIEQGVPENHKLVFEMEADQNPEQLPGDVIFTISAAAHRTFQRRGKDLETNYRISLAEALLGFSRSFQHLDGRDVTVSESGVVQYNQKRVLSGEGMPIHNVPSEKGDLTITYQVDLPTSITAEQKKKLQEVL